MGRIISMSVGVLLAIGPADVVFSETPQQNGVEAAWKACQECRQKFDTYRLAAATKLAKGDVVAAAKAAMGEFFNMFDGANIRFTWTGNGVDAEEMAPGSKVPFQRTELTLAQFNRLLVGSEGQYDNVLEKSISVVVQEVAKSDGIHIEPQQPQPDGPKAAQFQKQAYDPINRAARPAGQLPSPAQDQVGQSSSVALRSGSDRPLPTDPKYNMSTEAGIRAQATRIYPWASQSEQRELWIADRMSEHLDREAGNSYSVRVKQ
jgi:hypothetical protein